jgi:hypothetical protein
VSTFGALEAAAASFRLVEAVAPPFSFLVFMTKAQPSLATCVITAARCGGEKLGDRRSTSDSSDASTSEYDSSTSDSIASASSCSSLALFSASSCSSSAGSSIASVCVPVRSIYR